MKLLLTSSGISNDSIKQALLELLDKPIEEAKALFIPTAIYPFPQGAFYAGNAIWGTAGSKLVQLSWESVGLLELSVLPSIDQEVWASAVSTADVLLAWGGDPLFLAYWLRRSGLIDLLNSMEKPPVYVGVSAGSMATAAIFAETYSKPPGSNISSEHSEAIQFKTPEGTVQRILITGQGAGWVDFAIIPHFENTSHPDACGANAAIWAGKIAAPVYAIDDKTALKVADGRIEVISEGSWKLINAQ